MKIPKDTIDAIAAAIHPLDTETMRAQYRTLNIERAGAVKDINKRYRWDLAHAARVDICALYDTHGANDSHVDSALRSIVPPLDA